MFDPETLRNTLTYIRADTQRVPALTRAAELIEATLAELRAVERRRLAPVPHGILKIKPRRGASTDRRPSEPPQRFAGSLFGQELPDPDRVASGKVDFLQKRSLQKARLLARQQTLT
ncbi:MAG TPA: hypothetical protein VFI48_11070 [Hyphomicrobiaceae bacterium]|nr:hypothetical protein [Hyphomicrobiaceae bacterium]